MLCRFLLIILLDTSLFRKVMLEDAVFVNKNLTYSAALNYCKRMYNGSVWDLSEQCVQDGKAIWDKDRHISPWISVIGCYRKGSSTPRTNWTIDYRTNWKEMVVDCILRCNEKNTVALQNTTCVCIEATLLNGLDFREQPSSNCNYGLTGGKDLVYVRNFYTVYQTGNCTRGHYHNTTVETDKISNEPNNDYFQCVYQNCRNKTTNNLFAADCNIPPRQTICDTFVLSAQQKWDQGVFNCWRNHSKFLRGFQENSDRPLCDAREEGWIGVFRLFVCSAVLYHGPEQLKPMQKHCSDTYPFICVLPESTGNGCRREILSATPSTLSNTRRVHSSTVSQASLSTTKEVNTTQPTTPPPEFKIEYILIIAIGLSFLLVITAAGLLFCRKYKRQGQVGLTLIRKDPNAYVDFKADNSGTTNTENNNVALSSNYDEISDNSLTRKQTTRRRHEGIENEGLNDNEHCGVRPCDTGPNVKSNEYDTIRETTKADKYDTFQPNRDDRFVILAEYSTTRDLFQNNEYDILQTERNNPRPLDMYDTTRNLNSNSEYDVFQNSKGNEHKSEDYSTARDVMKEGEYDLIKK